MEYVRSVRVMIDVDTNKSTNSACLERNDDESTVDFAARVNATIARMTDV